MMSVMYFPDLSPYSYDGEEDPHVLNVGWLDAEHAFPTSEPNPAVVEGLKRLALTNERNVMRGWHDCRLCERESPIRVPYASATRGEILLGHSEIFVPDPDGGGYAAPALVVHYIADHQYAPPLPFVQAVLRQVPSSPHD